ncbi:MAG TPA: phage protease, partial [Puia sp.]|nr:phage protease [Puia sp.]
PALMLAGQTGPTVTQWEVAEASIVDIPGCKNALAIREDGKLIKQTRANAAEFKLKLSKIFDPDMDFLKLAAKIVGLPETATQIEVENKIAELQNGLTAEAGRTQDLQQKLTASQTEITNLKREQTDRKIADLVDGAVTARKITAKEAEHYRKLAAVDFVSTQAILDNLKPYESVEKRLKEGKEGDELAELSKLSWDQLDQQNKLALVKEKYPDLYRTKYKATFNKEPKNQ